MLRDLLADYARERGIDTAATVKSAGTKSTRSAK